MADTPKHSVSVAGIVVDDQDRVLAIQRRDNAHWEPPGGVLEASETPQDGVRREVLEETGIVVEPLALAGVYKNMAASVVSLVFRCKVLSGEPRATSESLRTAWVSLDSVRELMKPAYAVRVTDAFRDSVPVRVHDGQDLIGEEVSDLPNLSSLNR